MSVISTLSVSLVARTQKFTQGLSRAQKSLKGFQRSTSMMSGGIGKMAGLLTGVAGTAGLVSLVNSQREAIDSTGKLADLFSLTTEQLVGYQHAASLADVSNEGLNTSLRMFQKNLAMARDGSKAAADAFGAMGLDPAELGLMSTDAALKAVADRLPMITDQFTRTQTALALFGRSGLPFVKVLQEGSAGLVAAEKEARKLGLSFTRIDAAKVEAANDAVTRMRAVFVGLGRDVAIGVSPLIQALSEKITESRMSGETFGTSFLTVAEHVAKATHKMGSSVGLVTGQWNLFKAAVLEVGAIALRAFSFIVEGVDKLTKSIREMGIVGKILAGPFTLLGNIDISDFSSELSRASKDIAGKLSEEASKQFATGADKIFGAALGESTDKIGAFFADLNRRATESAEKAAAAAALPSNGLTGGPASTSKGDPFGAKQVNLANVFVGALKSARREKQATADDGTHSRLEKINRSLQRLGGMQAVTV